MAGPVLEEIATALHEWRPPTRLPERPDRAGSPAPVLLRARLDGLERQLEVPHHAVTR